MNHTFCHECAHCFINPTGPLFCVQGMKAIPTRIARSDSGECGPEATYFQMKDEDYDD